MSNIVKNGDLQFSTGRTASYVIAASNATDLEKAQADVTCPGTEAGDTAIFVAANAVANGGIVSLSTGTFNISTLTLNNCTLCGQGSPKGNQYTSTLYGTTPIGTIINVTGGIIIHYGGRLHGVLIMTNASFAGTALTVGEANASVIHEHYVSNAKDLIKDVSVWGAVSTQGIGICISYTSSSMMSSINIDRYNIGMLIGTSGVQFSNSNTILGLSIQGSGTLLKMINDVATGAMGVDANYIQCSLQPRTGFTTSGAIIMEGCDRNIIEGFIWDWTESLHGTAISMDADCTGNQFTLNIPIKTSPYKWSIIDLGTRNRILDLAHTNYTTTARTYTVREYGGDFTTLSAAMSAISTPSPTATNIYTVHVFGNITETSAINGVSYVNVFGHNATITSSSTGYVVNTESTTNYTWNDITFIGTAVPQYGTALYIAGGDSTCIFNNCTFKLITADSLNRYCFGIEVDISPVFNNCNFIITGTSGNNASPVLIASNSKAIFNNCIASIPDSICTNSAWSFSNCCSPTLNNCIGIAGNSKAAYYISANAAPILNNCSSQLKYASSSQVCTGAGVTQFKPYSSPAYHVISMYVNVTSAGAGGSTLQIGTSGVANAIASDIPLDSTGKKYFTITPTSFAAGNNIYATPSASATFTVYYTVIDNTANTYALQIASTTCRPLISGGHYLSNAASAAVYALQNAITWRITNATIESMNNGSYSVAMSGATADVPVYQSTLIGGLNNVTSLIKGSQTASGSGSWVVPNGETHVHITHGLGWTPVAGDIAIGFTTLDNSTACYINGYSSTEFVVNVNAAASAATTTGWWKAIR